MKSPYASIIRTVLIAALPLAGKEAVTFLIRIKESPENPARMLLEM